MFPLDKSVRITHDAQSYRALNLHEQTEIPMGLHPGAFAVKRMHHVHEGVDLYGLEGDSVVAIEEGEVVAMGPFTGPDAGSPWWFATDFLMVESAGHVLCYGEIRVESKLAVGQRVRAGQVLGHLAMVLRNDKGRPRSMLHLERYAPGARQSCGLWALAAPRPRGLLDPTPVLLHAAGFLPQLS